MVAKGLLDHGGVKRLDVIGAHQPETLGRGECDIQERLVAVALGQLRRRMVGADRLPDAPRRAARVTSLGYEVPPRRDDPGWIAPHPAHVSELDELCIAPQVAAQQCNLLGADDDERRLARRDPIADEACRRLEKLVLAGVQQCLVAKAGF